MTTRRTQIMMATMKLGKFDCMGDTKDGQILRELARSCGHVFVLATMPVEGYAPILRLVYREPDNAGICADGQDAIVSEAAQ